MIKILKIKRYIRLVKIDHSYLYLFIYFCFDYNMSFCYQQHDW